MLADSKTRGCVLYVGPSLIDNQTPIVAVATFESRNDKTGDMVQTWILRRDIEPHTAVKSGDDSPICGDCPLASGNGCYVRTEHAPLGVYRAFHRGSYPTYNRKTHLDLFRGREIRFGAYGDPVAVPYRVWSPLVDVSRGWSGYTHQWRDGRFWRFRRFLMASTETIADSKIAARRGWRYFRSTTDESDLQPREIRCVNETRDIQCIDCLACNGRKSWKDERVNIVILAHGSAATINAYQKSVA